MMRRRECRIKCRGTVRAEGRCQEVVVTQSKASEVVDQESTVVGPCPGPNVMVQEYGSLCIHVSSVSIFTFPLTVFISEMSDGEYLSRLKSRFCLSVWNAESVENAGFYEYSKLIYVLSSKLFGRMIG